MDDAKLAAPPDIQKCFSSDVGTLDDIQMDQVPTVIRKKTDASIWDEVAFSYAQFLKVGAVFTQNLQPCVYIIIKIIRNKNQGKSKIKFMMINDLLKFHKIYQKETWGKRSQHSENQQIVISNRGQKVLISRKYETSSPSSLMSHFPASRALSLGPQLLAMDATPDQDDGPHIRRFKIHKGIWHQKEWETDLSILSQSGRNRVIIRAGEK